MYAVEVRWYPTHGEVSVAIVIKIEYCRLESGPAQHRVNWRSECAVPIVQHHSEPREGVVTAVIKQNVGYAIIVEIGALDSTEVVGRIRLLLKRNLPKQNGRNNDGSDEKDRQANAAH